MSWSTPEPENPARPPLARAEIVALPGAKSIPPSKVANQLSAVSNGDIAVPLLPGAKSSGRITRTETRTRTVTVTVEASPSTVGQRRGSSEPIASLILRVMAGLVLAIAALMATAIGVVCAFQGNDVGTVAGWLASFVMLWATHYTWTYRYD